MVEAAIPDKTKAPYVPVFSLKDDTPMDILKKYFKRRACEFSFGMVLLFFGQVATFVVPYFVGIVIDAMRDKD